MTSMPDERRLANLRALLGFPKLPPREPELWLLASLSHHVDRLPRDREMRELLTAAVRPLGG